MRIAVDRHGFARLGLHYAAAALIVVGQAFAQGGERPAGVAIVEADLHVWEGMFHGFFYNVDVPESRDCYDVIVKFFERHLGRH